MSPRKSLRTMLCAAAAAAATLGGVSACGKDSAGNGAGDNTKVTYEISSSTGKPFKVAFIEKTDTDDLVQLRNSATNATATSPWKKEVVLTRGSAYAMVVVSPDPKNFDTASKYSCKITAGGKTVDEQKDQGGIVVGCAGAHFQDQVKPNPAEKGGS